MSQRWRSARQLIFISLHRRDSAQLAAAPAYLLSSSRFTSTCLQELMMWQTREARFTADGETAEFLHDVHVL